MPAYPNLGFSFTLLGILVALNLMGTRCAAIAQVVFVSVALAGMLALVGMGLQGSPEPLPPVEAGWWPLKASFTPLLSLLFPFLGYELAGFLWERTGKPAGRPAVPMVAGIITAACLFALWCFVSLSYVPSLKLQETTVPYAYVARAIAGETGRMIMGVVLLAGALATANALLLAVPLMASGLPVTGLLPYILRGRVFIVLLLGGGIALIMAAGLGGSPNLPIF